MCWHLLFWVAILPYVVFYSFLPKREAEILQNEQGMKLVI